MFHVPDNHFDVPIDRMYMGQFPYTMATAHGNYPPYRDAAAVTVTRTHFSLPLSLMAPPVSIPARLLYFSRSEVITIVPDDDTPQDRAHALALGQTWVRPTLADLLEFNAQRAAIPPPLVPPGFTLLSFQHDNCFQRLIDCADPFRVSPFAPYTLGSMTGDFSGRMLVRDASFQSSSSNLNPAFVDSQCCSKCTDAQYSDLRGRHPDDGRSTILRQVCGVAMCQS